MRILIAFGSKHGGSEGIAEHIAETLREAGHEVVVRPSERLDGVAGFDTAIVGAGLYAGRWVRSARRLIERNVPELRRMPVWMFSSGPLDDSARDAAIPPTSSVARLMKRIGARGHVTFGGRLAENSKGFIARALVEQGKAGDFRDLYVVAAWARGIASELERMPALELVSAPASRVERPLRLAIAGLCSFTGVTALIGGVPMVLAPDGGESMRLTMLEGSPFHSFLVPGLLLAGVVGLLNLIAGTLVLRRHAAGELAGVAAGVALTTWIVVQVLMLGPVHWLQALYAGIGLLTITGAAWLERLRHPRARRAQLRTIRQVPTPAITS